MSTKIEEVIGLVSGLAAVVKDQQTVSKDVTSETQKQIQDLSKAVHELSQSVRSKENSSSPLRLPQLTLPEFTGKENLDRFAEQLTNVLISSGVSPKFWFTYLKQQCQKDARAFDIICTFERTHASQLSDKSTPDEYGKFYDRCLALLVRQRGIPKEEQIRQLLATYYAMTQQPKESVSDFSHRFLETQHCLEKLIPGIHRSSDSAAEIELIHAFTMKLKPEIARELLSRETPFKDLTAVIEAAKRHESVENVAPHTPSPSPSQDARNAWKPEALFSSQNRPERHRADEEHETKPKPNFYKQKDNNSRGNESHVDYEIVLVETLTKHYKKGGRPVKSNKQPVIVYYDLKVTKLEKLLTVNQLLIIHTYVMMVWNDPHLTWNTTEFNGTEVITLEPSSIWTPDIMLYNTADDENRGISDIYKAPINVFPNGTAVWYVPVVWKSSCMVDITWFPVDTQTCKMIFASLSYTKSRLQLRYHSLPENADETKGNNHVTNGEWDYQGVKISYAETHYGCCNEPVQEIIYEVKIKRKPLFFLLYMIFPVCAVVLLSLLSFVIPTDSGERVGFGVTMLLTMGVYLMVISEDLPKTAQRAPLIGVLYVTLFYIMIISYIASTVTMSCANKETKPPKFLRMLAKGQAKPSEHHRINSFRNRTRSSHSIENGCNGGQTRLVVDFEGGERDGKDQLKMTEFQTHKVKDEEKLLVREIIPDDHDERHRNNEEWIRIAAFLDKAFFWLFLALIFISTGTIFLALEIMHT